MARKTMLSWSVNDYDPDSGKIKVSNHFYEMDGLSRADILSDFIVSLSRLYDEAVAEYADHLAELREAAGHDPDDGTVEATLENMGIAPENPHANISGENQP